MSNNSEKEGNKPVQTLFNAVSSIKLRLVRLLIEGGIHIDTRNNLEQTPLLAACASLQKNHLGGETRAEVVKYLLSAGASVNVQDNTGRTPLIYAIVTQAKPSVIFDLVEAGAELWVEDLDEKCAFDYVLQRYDMRLVAVMVEAYKRYNSPTHKARATIRTKLSDFINSSKNVLSPKRKTSAAEKNTQKYLNSQKQKGVQRDNSVQEKLSKKSNTIQKGTYVDNAVQKGSSMDNRVQQGTLRNNAVRMDTSVDSKVQKGTPRDNMGTPRDNMVEEKTYGDSDNSVRRFSDPECPPMFPNATAENVLCRLCKSIVRAEDMWPETSADADDPQMTFQEYNLSGLIYRRRSTGSLFNLSDEQCDAIQRKNDLGITLEDLFSAPGMNHPEFGSNQSLFIKSTRTNAMVDISGKSLLVPGGARSRSASVSLPPKDNLLTGQRSLADRSLSCTASDEGILLGPRPARKPLSFAFNNMPQTPQPARRKRGIQRIYMASDGSDNEDWDDILVIPSSQMTSTNTGMTTSECEDDRVSPGNPLLDDGRSSSRNSPIPKIVFTDFVTDNYQNTDSDDE